MGSHSLGKAVALEVSDGPPDHRPMTGISGLDSDWCVSSNIGDLALSYNNVYFYSIYRIMSLNMCIQMCTYIYTCIDGWIDG